MRASVLVVSFQLSDHGGTFKRLQLWNRCVFDHNFHLLYSARTRKVAKEVFTTSNSFLKVTELSNKSNKLVNYLYLLFHVYKTLRLGSYSLILPIGTAAEIISFVANSISLRKCDIVIYRAGSPIPVKLGDSLKGGFMKRVLQSVYKKSYRVVAINESLKNILIQDFYVDVSKVEVIPISVTLDEKQQVQIRNRERSKNNLVFGVMSRLTEEKGVQHILEAVSSLKKITTGEFTLLIYGEGPYRDFLEYKTQSLDLTDTVFFKGWIDRQFEALGAIDCLLIGSRFEGTPRSILEAALLNIPTVSTNVGGIPSVITDGDTGWLYGYSDIQALTRILKMLYDEPERLAQVGASVHDLVIRKYSLEAETARIKEMFFKTAR